MRIRYKGGKVVAATMVVISEDSNRRYSSDEEGVPFRSYTEPFFEGQTVQMKEQGFSQGRTNRETGLSYNNVKDYLRRLEGID